MFASERSGTRARGHTAQKGPWALVGIVTSLLALFLSLATVLVVLLLFSRITVAEPRSRRTEMAPWIASPRRHSSCLPARSRPVDPVEQRLVLARVLLEPDAAGVGLLASGRSGPRPPRRLPRSACPGAGCRPAWPGSRLAGRRGSCRAPPEPSSRRPCRVGPSSRSCASGGSPCSSGRPRRCG